MDQVFHIDYSKWSMIGELSEFSSYLPLCPLNSKQENFFFIDIDGVQKGPFSVDKIERMVKNKLATPYHYIKVEGGRSWKIMKDWPDFSKLFNLYQNRWSGEPETTIETKPKSYVRKEKRVPFIGEIRLSTRSGEFVGRISDISTGGLFFYSKETLSFKKNEMIQFSIYSQLHRKLIVGRAIIRYVKKNTPSGVGLKFLSLSEEDRDIIKRFVDDFIIQSGGRVVESICN
jgi:hypothetical protein